MADYSTTLNRILPGYPTCDNDCSWHGYTKELFAYGGDCDLHISVKPDTDLDSRFKAFCHDEQEMINLNGWLFTFEGVGI